MLHKDEVSFKLASLAIAGLFGVARFGRREFDFETRLPGFDRATVVRRCCELAFGATLMQLIAGTLVHFTLPTQGVLLVGRIYEYRREVG